MTEPRPPFDAWRVVRLAVLAAVLAFLVVSVGWGMTHFLVSAYHHGGL
jgi:hypothetical protein